MTKPKIVEAVRELPSDKYLLVSNQNSRILRSSPDRYELIKLAGVIRRAGGRVTIFKATKL